MGRRIINKPNGDYFERDDDKKGDRIINLGGGNYNEHVAGDSFTVQGNSWDEAQGQRQDYSGNDAVDVNAEEVKDEPKKGWLW